MNADIPQVQAWMSKLDIADEKNNTRMQNEVRLNVIYSKEFKHGTEGHNIRMLVARQAEMLTEQEREIERLNRVLEQVNAQLGGTAHPLED